jgi:hypothetical protein
MRVQYKQFSTTFRGAFNGRWAVDDAAEFASRIDPERLISISESRNGLVTVWYWEDDPLAKQAIGEKEERIQRLGGR